MTCFSQGRDSNAEKMGKKGRWFSALKRVFTHNSKEKPVNGSDKKNSKEKKKGKGILTKSETKSFIPLFREPSSIEKILGEADHLFISPPTPSELPKTPITIIERPTSPKVVDSPNVVSPRVSSTMVTSPKLNSSFATSSSTAASSKAAPPRAIMPGATSSKTNAPKILQSWKEINYVQKPEPTIRTQHLAATKIQSAYRGYVARRSFRALRGLVRLQGVVRGQNVKRQTANAMKQMQLLVRVQTQIQSRRIQMLESQANKNDKEVESTLSKWTQLSEAANNENWDDSAHTKEEVEARLRKKVEAVIKRERAMAYAYSHQLWKSNPRSAQSTLGIQSNGYPWWWNWLERQLPSTTSQSQAATKNVALTPPRPTSNYKPSPQFHSITNKLGNSTIENQESLTPRSSRLSIPTKPKFFQMPSRTPPPRPSSSFAKYSKPRASAPNSSYDVKDDDSLMSCPPFSVPNYMTLTVSAKAKARANSNPKERLLSTPSNDSKRRFSFPMTPNIGSFKWNKGSNKEMASQNGVEKHKSTNSIGDLSIDSAVSMPAIGGRKPFNRYV